MTHQRPAIRQTHWTGCSMICQLHTLAIYAFSLSTAEGLDRAEGTAARGILGLFWGLFSFNCRRTGSSRRDGRAWDFGTKRNLTTQTRANGCTDGVSFWLEAIALLLTSRLWRDERIHFQDPLLYSHPPLARSVLRSPQFLEERAACSYCTSVTCL